MGENGKTADFFEIASGKICKKKGSIIITTSGLLRPHRGQHVLTPKGVLRICHRITITGSRLKRLFQTVDKPQFCLTQNWGLSTVCPDFFKKSGIIMVAEAGLEPTTSGL